MLKMLVATVSLFGVAFAVGHISNPPLANAEAPQSENLKYCSECDYFSADFPGMGSCRSVNIGFQNCFGNMPCVASGDCMVWF